MANAVLDAPKETKGVVAEAAEEAVVWKMPSVQRGDIVDWYEQADTRKPPKPLFVTKVKQRSIEGQLVIDDRGNVGTFKADAMHVSDPEIDANDRENVRMDHQGGWDYSRQAKQRVKWEAEVVARLYALEEAMKETLAKATGRKS